MADIDPVTGNVVGSERVLKEIQQRTTGNLNILPKGSYYTYSDFEISPNDSILYYLEEEFILDSIGNKRIGTYIDRVFSWRFRDGGSFNPVSIFILDQYKQPNERITSIDINPYGKLNIIVKKLGYLKGITMLNLQETNRPKGLSSTFSIVQLPGTWNTGNLKAQLYLYDFIRLSSKIDYSCDAIVSFQNESDVSGGMSDFTWYFTKESGKIDTIRGFEPKVIFKKSGNYPFKVQGNSSRGNGYSEWYIDTIHIRIPEKPIASFKSSDTIVCRYLPVQFNNHSLTGVIKPGIQPKYIWTFGDGSPSSDVFEPKYTYSQPGNYTVSLFYSNGYCDSTLVKNQYIHVVDAPKSGFIVGSKQGCSPFTLQVTDTVSLNVFKKEYLFSDSTNWRPISTPRFSYTFTKPGHFWAVQKLYGYTGCIIRADSIQVFVSKGITSNDSIHIVSASYDMDNVLHLDWLPNSAAISYLAYKSLNGMSFFLLGKTNDTFIVDKAVPIGQVFYQVKAMDSCGSFSSSHNLASPAFISGRTVNDNEAALINQSMQKGFGEPLKYELFGSFDSKFKFIELQSNPANPFTDIDFAEQGALRKCYRLLSHFTNQDMYSNNFCLNYMPLVFLPNAFTPDGNGLNDKFGPITYGIQSYSLNIYNQWGEIIYTGNEAWNGNYKGQTVQDGVYFYQINLIDNNQKNIYRKGVIQVIK
jgi:gliding motility-associated-like protein